MTCNSAMLPAVRGRLARYLGQLRHHLDAVGEQARRPSPTRSAAPWPKPSARRVYDALLPQANTAATLPRSASRPAELFSSSRPSGRAGVATRGRRHARA